MRRFPKFHYSYVAVDPSHTRRLSLDPRLTVVPYDGHNLRTPLGAFVRICRAMVPNVHHEKIVLSPATHVCTLVASRNGDVVGGITFRMLTAHPIKTGAAVPRLILEIVLMAVRMEDHGHGIGTKLVLHAKAIATAHAAQLGMECLHVIVQADNGATPFWSKRGFKEEKMTKHVVIGLNRWWPQENCVYLSATPMGCYVALGNASDVPPLMAQAQTCPGTTPGKADAQEVVAQEEEEVVPSHPPPSAPGGSTSVGTEIEVAGPPAGLVGEPTAPESTHPPIWPGKSPRPFVLPERRETRRAAANAAHATAPPGGGSHPLSPLRAPRRQRSAGGAGEGAPGVGGSGHPACVIATMSPLRPGGALPGWASCVSFKEVSREKRQRREPERFDAGPATGKVAATEAVGADEDGGGTAWPWGGALEDNDDDDEGDEGDEGDEEGEEEVVETEERIYGRPLGLLERQTTQTTPNTPNTPPALKMFSQGKGGGPRVSLSSAGEREAYSSDEDQPQPAGPTSQSYAADALESLLPPAQQRGGVTSSRPRSTAALPSSTLAPPSTWACTHCTLENEDWRVKCQVCLRVRRDRPEADRASKAPTILKEICDMYGTGPAFAAGLGYRWAKTRSTGKRTR